MTNTCSWCDSCAEKDKCAFYEAGAEECVYEVLAVAAERK